MRATTGIAFCLWVSAAAFSQTQTSVLIPAPYLAPKYVAPVDAPSVIIMAADEPGDLCDCQVALFQI